MRRFLKKLGWGDAPRRHPAHFALGLALGMLIGILPKDSLLPYAIGVFALLLPVSLGATTLAAILCSLAGTALDGVAGTIGQASLSTSAIAATVAGLQSLPLVAWMRLDNTVVMGLLVIGVIAAIPVYLFSHWLFRNLPDDRFDDFAHDTSPTLFNPTLQES